MLSNLWGMIGSKLYLIGAAVLAVLAFFARVQFLKGARDRAVLKADTLKATVHAQRVKERIKKEEDIKLSSRRAEIAKEIEDIKKIGGKKHEGIGSLSKPNDDWS